MKPNLLKPPAGAGISIDSIRFAETLNEWKTKLSTDNNIDTSKVNEKRADYLTMLLNTSNPGTKFTDIFDLLRRR